MARRNRLVRRLQAISAEERARQPPAADWLWAQDNAQYVTISAEDPAQIEFWATVLNASGLEVRNAIGCVGASAVAIRKFLDR